MQSALIALILGSVLLSSTAQIMLKYGMTADGVQSALTGQGGVFQILIAIAMSPLVSIGLITFGLGAVLWLFVLSKIPLSSAYPFVALGIVITVAAGRFLFAEPTPSIKLIGVALIVTGVLAVASSG